MKPFFKNPNFQLLDPFGEYLLSSVNWCFYSLVAPPVTMSTLSRDESFFVDLGVPAQAYLGNTQKPTLKQMLNQIY